MIDARAIFAHAMGHFASLPDPAPTDRHLAIAGRAVRLRFASPHLADHLSRAFRHLLTPPVHRPDLTILSWAGPPPYTASPGAPSPGAPPDRGAMFQDGPCPLYLDLATRRLHAYDPARQIGLFHLPDQPAPFLRIFHWWAAGQDLQLVHGAALATERGAALLAGRGGSGKSTTALACVGSPLRYLADDYCLLAPAAPRVHSLFATGKADARSLALLPHLAPAFEPRVPDPGGKSIIFLAEHAAASLVPLADLRAVVVPRVGAAICALHPISAMEALRALAPSTMLQLPGHRARSLARIAATVRALPCWRLDLGPDPAAAHAALRTAIDHGA